MIGDPGARGSGAGGFGGSSLAVGDAWPGRGGKPPRPGRPKLGIAWLTARGRLHATGKLRDSLNATFRGTQGGVYQGATRGSLTMHAADGLLREAQVFV